MKPLGKIYFVVALIWLAGVVLADWNEPEFMARGVGNWAGLVIPLGLLVFFGRRRKKGTK